MLTNQRKRNTSGVLKDRSKNLDQSQTRTITRHYITFCCIFILFFLLTNLNTVPNPANWLFKNPRVYTCSNGRGWKYITCQKINKRRSYLTHKDRRLTQTIDRLNDSSLAAFETVARGNYCFFLWTVRGHSD